MATYKLLSPKSFVTLLQTETNSRIIPIDATWYLPNLKRDGHEEFLTQERIPRALYFDIDGIKDRESPYPHMAPSLSTFNKAMSQLGVRRDDILVVYDRIGNFSAPRCAWTLALFGHPTIYLLNNFNVYKKEGYPLDTTTISKDSPYHETNYASDVDLSKQEIVPYDQMFQLVQNDALAKEYNVFDARALGRFEGKDPEPRPGLPSGHIKGAQPLPFTEVLDSNDKTYPEDEVKMNVKLQDAFRKLNNQFDPKKPTICMCGTGVTGAIIKNALEISGVPNVKLYDGSWTEWALKAGDDSSLIAKNRE
ncbi:thiosulfate sulfurtransferase NDAI_0E01080 [Naumovozyma dairenensis CBS 421]|uniref:Sulfurtransferase n=1 Tax=Naumovozyma dairenensis (strain ATCC 10597 / BCRC 20456 / CBS 421 / NBRC 0211 / NRRL Y-12639) TaxID=1071378 RepID=G0WB04_NAUDC|nr:hypothetical protein NDAI_0E01080 [Naumovozyma dairenensis CBS 421]CCD24924.1 hypothetical protein NDAI_0E01080 [Naumovozyma dairenensis CBS 421]